MTSADRLRPIRVLLASDHEVLTLGLCRVLAPLSDRVDVVRGSGAHSSGEDILAAVSQTDPHVVMVEVSRLRVHLIAELLTREPGLTVVAIGHDGDTSWLDALSAGAKGYVFTSLSGPELAQAIEVVAHGQTWLDPRLTAAVIGAAVSGNGNGSSNGKRLGSWPGASLGLGRRESEVLILMSHGNSNRAIADQLGVGQETVKSHAASVYRKLGAKDRAHAVAKALREGIID